MNKYLQTKTDLHILALIHLTITATVLFLFTLSPGCIEEDDELGTGLGKEYSTTEVATAFYKALKDSSIDNLQKGAAVMYEINQRVELGKVVATGEVFTFIDEKIDRGEYYELTYSTFSNLLEDGQVVDSTPKKQFTVDFPDDTVNS